MALKLAGKRIARDRPVVIRGGGRRVIYDPMAWRALSSLLLVAFIIALVVGPGIPQWGWIALLASGATFAVELALLRRRGASGEGD